MGGGVVRTELILPKDNITDTDDGYKYLGIPQANGRLWNSEHQHENVTII